jgi:hypothetical protein
VRILAFWIAVASVAIVTACSSSGGSYPPSLTASPNVSAASPGPTPVAATIPVAITTPAPGSTAAAIAKAPIPAPTGYTSTITIPIAAATAGATVSVTSGTTLPANLPVLASNARKGTSHTVRLPQAGGGYAAIFYDAIVPSAPITVAGNIVASQGFPPGILSGSTSYYLGFYDSSQPNPAWQTIAGPVTTSDGVSLTFSGTAGSFSLLTNQVYGFAIFSLANSLSTPPPAQQTLAYLAEGTSGVVEVNAAGVTATTLPLTIGVLGLDDAGNIYGLQRGPSPAPGPSGSSPTPNPPTIAEYAAGSTTAAKTYTPSNPYGIFVLTAGTGAFTALGFSPPSVQATSPTGISETFDVWDSGASAGAPSRTIVEPSNGVYFGLMSHDGSLYAPHVNADGTFQYDVYAAGSSSVARVIPETSVSAANQPNFTPNYAAIGPDGSLYVTEYTFFQPDPLAGLYIYAPSGKETFVATTSDANGPGPQGVDLDASGNIYVVNNNAAAYNPNTGYGQNDSLHDIEVFGPGGVGGPNGSAAPLHITGSFTGFPIDVSADGTIFFSSFYNDQISTGPSAMGTGVIGTFAVAAGTSTITQVSSLATAIIVLYDGNRETTSTKRKATSLRASGSLGIGGWGPVGHRASIARRLAALRRR